MHQRAETLDRSGDSARAVVARYFRIWNDGDTSHLADIIAPEWVDHAHPERRSISDVRAAIVAARASRPTSRVFVDAILGEGDLITVNGRVENEGAIENRVWIVRVEDGLIREIWAYSGD